MKKYILAGILVLQLVPVAARSDEIRVAVASNFNHAMKAIADAYQLHSKHKLVVVFGSTGKLYAQIHNGAPYDIFLAADEHRPRLLEEEEFAQLGSRFTYAEGRLVLWSPVPGLVDGEGKVLEKGEIQRIAMANPKLAPYGAAAKHALLTRGVWRNLKEKMVFGENISQTMHFVQSGNAAIGFVALSQIMVPGKTIQGSYWIVPQTLYPHIQQQAVLLKPSNAAKDFFTYLKSDEARKIIQQYGYRLH